MMGAIQTGLKYSLLVLLILVLSHVIEIKGVSISQHVLTGMHLVSGFSPWGEVRKLTEEYSKTIDRRKKEIEEGAIEFNPADEKALNRVIEGSRSGR